MRLTITRDRTSDVAYLSFDDAAVARTLEAAPGMYFDLDERGHLIGVELLRASDYLDRDELTIIIPTAPVSEPVTPELVFG